MRSTTRVLAAAGVWLLLVWGCEGRAPEPPVADEVPAEAPEEPAERPDEREDTVAVEGMPEAVRLVLYRSPEGYPLPFTTYVPSTMEVTRDATGEADEVLFVASFGGVRNEAAALRVMVHRAGASEWEVVEVLRQLARDLGTELVELPEPQEFGWSLREFRNAPRRSPGQTVQGRLALGVLGDRFFTVAIHYPPEYGDGFEPRARQILREWRWQGSSRPLVDGGP